MSICFSYHPELPPAGAGSPVVGVGLWNNMPVALVVEAALVVIGMYLFFPRNGLSRAKQLALGVLSLLVLALTIAGLTVAPTPPSAAAMAASALITIVILCLLIGWLGKGSKLTKLYRS